MPTGYLPCAWCRDRKEPDIALASKEPKVCRGLGEEKSISAVGMAKDLLASRHKALRSNPSTAKNIKGE
jgi:hypothetical protein